MGCEEDRKVAHSEKREVQQGVRCWGCEELGHCLWACPRKVAHPRKGEAQQKVVRRAEVRGEQKKELLKREWQTKEREAAVRKCLVKEEERGWIERRGVGCCVVSIVTCGYCGDEGTAEGENFVRMDSMHDM